MDPNFMFQAKTELLMLNSPLTYYQYRTGMLSMIIYRCPTVNHIPHDHLRLQTLPASITSPHLPLKKVYPHIFIRVEFLQMRLFLFNET